MSRTVSLTVAQAMVKFLSVQHSESDGVEQKLFAGCLDLLDMAGYVLGTVLTVTPESVDYNNRVILKMTDPDGYAGLKTALDAAALRLKQERVTTIWVPRKEEVSERDKRVKVSGKLKTYIADKLTSERDKDYLVEFSVTTSGRLYVSKIEEFLGRAPAQPAGS